MNNTNMTICIIIMFVLLSVIVTALSYIFGVLNNEEKDNIIKEFIDEFIDE